MNNKIKTYKILVDSSKIFANMRGSTPAEVAKKAASKILGNSLNRTRFSMVEAKTGKIRHYDAKRENLVRSYHKNGKLIKYRIVVKKLGKQVGGTYPPNLEDESDPIFQFFPREKYKINIQTYAKSNIAINILSNSKWSPNCVKFFVKDKKDLYIDQLDQCDSNSGSINLNKIIEYAKYLKGINIIDKITLQDESEIIIKPNDSDMKLSIDLWLLSILCKGISWYNSFGFVSTEFKEEVEHNSSLLLLNFEDFLNICKMTNDSTKESLLLTYGNINVKELFEEIKSNLKQSIDLDTLIDIKNLLEYIKSCEIIRYDKHLELIL